MENLTKPTSVHNIFNELKSIGMKVSKDYLYEREFEGLVAASRFTKCSNCRLVTFDKEGTYNYKGLDIRLERIWKW